MAITRIPMNKIVNRHRACVGPKGVDWFSDGAMAFFATKLPESGLALGSRIAFVTRETGPSGSAYSVRSFDWNTGKVDTVGKFHSYGRREASEAARQYLLTA